MLAFCQTAQAQSPLVLQNGVCKAVEWPVARSLPVCDINYIPAIKTQTRAVIVDNDLERLLDCIWEKESSRGKNMIGDNGLAIGHYQIHIHCHNVSYDCAMDFECSRDYTRQMILAGKGYLWTTYYKCL